MTLRFLTLGLGVLMGWFVAPATQDPVQPPAPAPAKPPVATVPAVASPAPAATPLPTDGTSKPKAHPLEGVYSLRDRILDGKPMPMPSRGYLCLTNRHMFLCLAAPGTSADKVLLRSSSRTWVPTEGGYVQSTVLLGWATDDTGAILFEKVGQQEQRRIEAIRGGVRVTQDARNWIDFERIE